MYQLAALMITRMMSVPRATTSPCAHRCFRSYGFSTDSLVTDAVAAGAATAAGSAPGALAGAWAGAWAMAGAPKAALAAIRVAARRRFSCLKRDMLLSNG